MGQRPIIKDGVVVNVIELDEETAVVTAEQHQQMQSVEDDNYAQAVEAWEEIIKVNNGGALGRVPTQVDGGERPERPKLTRAKRWVVPDGHEVGPEGGNIGETWDGQAFTKAPAVVEPE